MGIDSVIQFVAILFFLLGFAGVAMIVTAASRGSNVGRGIMLAAVGFVLGILFFVVSEGLLIVGPTERAVVFNNLSGELESPREPGIHIIIPAIQKTTIYRVSRQEYTMSQNSGEGNRSNIDDGIQARSIDGQEVLVDITIIFTLDPENVNRIHENWSDVEQGYIEGLIRPTLRSLVRDVIATARAEAIFGSTEIALAADGTPDEENTTPESRIEVQNQIEELVKNELELEGFTVIQVLLREINFSPDFINAIEQRQVAELERDRASIEAERARIQAEGRANAAIETARGEAEAVRIQASADAEALRLVSVQIAANPNLIQYLYVTNLSDNVNIALVPSSSPFLFDASSFIDATDDFVAPAVDEIVSPETESGD
ncbi:MAG: prohibitin family protein [Anaerolineae bacterium]|nr:prohibitin family protein [Anaerolineae bacterium]